MKTVSHALARQRWALLIVLLLISLPASTQVNVLTQHNDNARTGANLNETILTPANVNVNQFGMLFKRVVDDQVYGQPLVVTNISIAGGTHNVVYITTVHNSVYAFDADDPSVTSPYWHDNFGAPTANHFRCTDMNGNIGITGSPVIDGNTNTLYVVSLNGSTQHLHALDISTGIERSGSPVALAAPGFSGTQENQRPALLLSNGIVYVGFSSHCDQGTYHGFLLAYNASTLQQVGVFNTSPSGNAASIWHSGTGPAVDVNGNIYIITANGSWDGVNNFSETFMKLSAGNLHLLDWFTPHDHATLDGADADVDSGGPLLIPGTSLLVGGGKGAKLYVVDTNNFGHVRPSDDSQIVQSFTTGTFNKQHLHSLAFWDSAVNGPMLYVWPQADRFKVFKFNGSTFNPTPFMIQPTANTGHPGGMLSISSNGNTNGIMWAAIMASGDAWHSSQPGVLHAFDADNINHEFWNSLQNSARDNCNNYSKMAPPTIANGKVYLPSFGTGNTGTGQLCVYGLLTPPSRDFSLKATPASQAVLPGNGTTFSVTVTPSGGFNSAVTLSISGLPTGATGSFSVNPIAGGSGSSTLSVSTSSTTPPGTYSLTVTGTGGGITHTATVTLLVNSTTANCVTATGGWFDTPFPSQSGTFTASFDAIPSSSTGHGIFGISLGAPTANGGFANVVAFNTNGTIVALNGGGYTGSLTYTGGATYHLRLAINVPAHTYSIFVTPPGGGEQTLGTDFAFRTAQDMVTSLDHYGVSEGVAGDTFKVCSFTIQ